MMIISGDREAEVRRLADRVGISEVYGGVSPEGKLAIVHELTAAGPTLFLGDGINDAPSLTAATAGVAFGATSDVTSEAADAVVLDSSLERLDDLMHIGARCDGATEAQRLLHDPDAIGASGHPRFT